ncbi:MAG TPA: endonuclease MutS2, partial [Armatimonadota bacterium]|nr:endonuclease MutS2 [Armatimonadota bacterium]
MDAHTLRVLEYEKVTAMLAGLCACSLGKGRVERLRPHTDPEWITARLAETAEARAALQELGMPPFGGLADIGEVLQRAGAGRMLEGHEVLQVAATARAGRLVREYFEGATRFSPSLAELAERLSDYQEIEEEAG